MSPCKPGVKYEAVRKLRWLTHTNEANEGSIMLSRLKMDPIAHLEIYITNVFS